MASEFQPNVPGFYEGQVTALEVLEITGVNPSSIIDKDDAFNVRVDWETKGMNGGQKLYGHHYTVRLFLEGLGNGQENQIGTTDVLCTAGTQAGPLQLNFTTGNINVPALSTWPTGLYKLVATIVHYMDAAGAVPSGTAGYDDGRMIQIID